MGKASQWFRGLLGLKRHDARSPASAAPTKPPKEKRRWSFVKSYRDKDHHATKHAHGATTTPPPTTTTTSYGHEEGAAGDPTKHAIAVAAATAAVAEAAHAAAQAAAAVVRLTSSGRCAGHPTAAHVSGSLVVAAREEWAALRIQSAFRGCLARRALRALKGLVKLQALVRGHIERKRTTEWLQRMQALLRAQARARAGRAQISESSYSSSSKSSHFHHTGPATPEKFEHVIRSKSIKHDQSPVLKRNGSKSNARLIGDLDKAHLGWNRSESRRDERSSDQRGCSTRTGTTDDEKNDKILEVDSGKPHFTKRKNLFNSSHHVLASDQYSHSFTTSKDSTTHHTVPSPSSCEVQSLSPLKFSHEVEDGAFYTADNSPQVFSASSRGGGGSKRSPFTPTKSDGSRSFLSGYSDHPNYMAFTESSRAKARSLSAPKQRPQYERSSSAKRYSESRSSAQKLSYLHANFASKAYPGSGRLDKLGMPVG